MSTPTPEKTSTPTIDQRDRERLLAQGGREDPRTREITMPDGRIMQPSGNGAYTVKPRPTASPEPTKTFTEKAADKNAQKQADAAYITPTATATPKPKTFTDIELMDGWIHEDPQSVGKTKAEYFKTGNNGGPLTAQQMQTLEAAVAAGKVPPHMQRALDEKAGETAWSKLGGPQSAEPPTSDLGQRQPPDELDPAEQQQILDQSNLQPARSRASAPGQPSAGNVAGPASPPELPRGYSRSWVNPGSSEGAPLGPITSRTASGQVFYGGGAYPRQDSQNWAYYDPNRTPEDFGRGSADQSGDSFMPGYLWNGRGYVPQGFSGGGTIKTDSPERPPIGQDPLGAMPFQLWRAKGVAEGFIDPLTGQLTSQLREQQHSARNAATANEPDFWNPNNPVPGDAYHGRFWPGDDQGQNPYNSPPLPIPVNEERGGPEPIPLLRSQPQSMDATPYKAGGHMAIRGPATLIDDATGQPIAKLGENRPEEMYSHPDGSVGIMNHVPHGLRGFASGGTIDPNDGTAMSKYYQTWLGQGNSASDPGNANFAKSWYDYAAKTNAGTDPNNPTASGTPIMGGLDTPSTASGSSYSGLSFPGTTIGSYSLPGLNAGTIPTSPFSYNGTGSIPQGQDVNQLENQSYGYLSGLQGYKSNFDTGLQGTLAGINNVRQDALNREQAASSPEALSALGSAQHLRDVYDPHYGMAGVARPTDVAPPVGTFGLPTGQPTTSGVGLRWALQTPEQQYNAVNQPLSEYESLIGKTASGVFSQITDAQDKARLIIAALKGENPSKPNPNGPGLVSSNQSPVGGNLTPQQQENDNAALLRAEMALETGQTGTITLPSGLSVTYSGRKPKAPTGGGGDSSGGGGGTTPSKPSSPSSGWVAPSQPPLSPSQIKSGASYGDPIFPAGGTPYIPIYGKNGAIIGQLQYTRAPSSGTSQPK